MNSYLIEYNEKIIGSYSDYNSAELFILSCYQNNLMTKDAYIHCYKMNSCYKMNTNIVTINNTSSSDGNISLHVLTPESIPESHITTNIGINVSPKNIKKKYLHSSDSSVCGSQSLDEDYQTKTPIEIISITPEIKLQNEKRINDIEKEKHDLIHNMNLLKLQQKKISEAKQVFEVDLKLFNQFKTATTKDPNKLFVIPELFVNKYKIMNKLFLENKLDWSNYYYEIELNNKGSNMYDEHFITNSYENSFINNTKSEKSDKINEEIYLDI
jgi:hypothetical protein